MSRLPDLIVVSNRLPVTVSCSGAQTHVRSSSGGLVTALEPVLRSLPATWIGWPGTDYAPAVEQGISQLDPHYNIVPVYLTAIEKEKYYLGFANQVLWPLFHDMQARCNFDPSFWSAYKAVNEKFADQVTATAKAGDLVWVHDYHLILVGEYVRQRRLGVRLAYFHHIPFPAPDIFATLPSGHAILRALLCFDHIGFQTENDKHNFVQCIRATFGKKVKLRSIGFTLSVQFDASYSIIAASPISIDSVAFRSLASSREVAARIEQLRKSFDSRRILLGVDRLDYTKGIPQRLAAFKLLLAQHPELHGNVVLLQLIVPSRETVPEYHALKIGIEQQISEINGTFGKPDWTPIVYMHRNVAQSELVALYRLAAVMAVTSLKDGMNLVAKEYCACNLDQSGALVLSRFAGAAQELGVGAFVVNPHDVQELAGAFLIALGQNSSAARTRMAAMQRVVMQHDVWHWLASATGTEADQSRPRIAGFEEMATSDAVA